MRADWRPVIGITLGDPGGIGAEVIVRALGDRGLRRRARVRIFGLGSALHAAAEATGIEPTWWRVEHDSAVLESALVQDVLLLDYERGGERGSAPFPARATRLGGELSLRFVEDAIAAARRGVEDPRRVDAIVTGPISKEGWSLAGCRFAGHTDLLAERCGAKRVAMMFAAPATERTGSGLRVVLATGHVPLVEIRDVLTIGRVFDAIDLGHEACVRLGIGAPRIAVAGLNPHAGEGGLLGDEEERIIEPAIRVAREHGMDVEGPYPGDTVFLRACGGVADLVVAMYHDQGLIPVKLLARDEAVNVTLGLAVVRTSPDHGTAYDIAGQGEANAGSMRAAIEMAIRLAGGQG